MWEAGIDIHESGYFGLCDGGGGGKSGVFRRTFLIGDEGGVFKGRKWYLQLGLQFCSCGGGSGSRELRIVGEAFILG